LRVKLATARSCHISTPYRSHTRYRFRRIVISGKAARAGRSAQRRVIYSITLSARPSNAGGMVTPRAIADLTVDEQVNFRRLLDRRVDSLLAIENAAGIDRQPIGMDLSD
jgi:hypothetical protein